MSDGCLKRKRKRFYIMNTEPFYKWLEYNCINNIFNLIFDVIWIYNNSTVADAECCHKVTGLCLLEYPNFKQHYKLIAIDLSKQQKLDAEPKLTQKIYFTGNPEKKATIFFIIQEAKETVLDFSKGTVKVLWF